MMLSPSCMGQNTNPCTTATMLWYFPDPVPFGWFIVGPGQGPYSYIIEAPTCPPPPACTGCCGGAASGSSAPPPASPSSGGAVGSSGPSPVAAAGQPIFLTNGDTCIYGTDSSLPGLGGGLTLKRTWNSLWPQNEITSSVGIFGPNWRSTYEERVFMDGNNYLTYARGDGGYWYFGLKSLGTFIPISPANISATLSQTANYVLLAFQNGEQRQFSLTTGQLTAIVDRNGNTTQLTYDSSNRLVTVTSPASQHLYFNYQSNTSFLVASVSTDSGTAFSYSYDTQGRLSQVTRPDQTTITYTYNTQSQITQVTDSNGKVLESHTYDSSGRGLTASQANGVNSVTVTYPQ
jgi:YD repeat-containing protein